MYPQENKVTAGVKGSQAIFALITCLLVKAEAFGEHPKAETVDPNHHIKNDEVWAGVFAASPEEQQGGQVRFAKFEIHPGSRFDQWKRRLVNLHCGQ